MKSDKSSLDFGSLYTHTRTHTQWFKCVHTEDDGPVVSVLFKVARTLDQIWCVSHQLTSRPAATPPSPSMSHDWHSQHSLPSSSKFQRSPTPNTWLHPLILAHHPQMVILLPPLSLSGDATPSSGHQWKCKTGHIPHCQTELGMRMWDLNIGGSLGFYVHFRWFCSLYALS